MRLSVVTPTHGKRALLERTLRSLETQDVGPDAFEVVVVDDGSPDDTPAFLAGYRPPYVLHVVRLDENRGRAFARNRGIDRAGGDVVVFLDDDMELVPGFLAAHRALHASTDLVAGVGNVVNHPEIVMAPIDRYMSTRGAQKVQGGRLPWRWFSSNNSSVKRAHLAAIGGFDERFRHYGFEDLELALRLEKELGVEIRFVEEARSLHIHPHTLEEVLAKKTLCGRDSMPYLFAKHPEARREMGYDRFDGPIYRMLLTPAVYHLVKPLARFPLGPVTNRVIDYLVLYHYLEGMKDPLPA